MPSEDTRVRICVASCPSNTTEMPSDVRFLAETLSWRMFMIFCADHAPISRSFCTSARMANHKTTSSLLHSTIVKKHWRSEIVHQLTRIQQCYDRFVQGSLDLLAIGLLTCVLGIQCWPVVLVCTLVAIAVSFLYLMILRFVSRTLVYFIIALVVIGTAAGRCGIIQ